MRRNTMTALAQCASVKTQFITYIIIIYRDLPLSYMQYIVAYIKSSQPVRTLARLA